jgi:N-acetylglucosaminyldiphosphoundecaprenol N-acetyl-beta-D-mannosaminyltransferase
MALSTPEVHGMARVLVRGVPFDAITENDLASRVVRSMDTGPGGLILTVNVDILRQLQTSGNSRILRLSRFVVADGRPVMWASRLQGTPLPSVVTGSSLIFSLTEEMIRRGFRVMIIGGPLGAAERAAQRLSQRSAIDASIEWYYPPMGFEKDEREILRLVGAIRSARPDLIFMGLGFPKQELVAEWLLTVFPECWIVGCGGAISMAAGDAPRAPRWMQRIGAEWLHRLRLEPRLLFRRYIMRDAPFAVRLLAGSWRARRAALDPAPELETA